MSDRGAAAGAVLFDLDGTLTDPFPGITRSIQHALRRLGAPVPEADDLRWCIGPPLADSFALLLGTTDKQRLDEAIAFYRERYTTVGLFENAVVDGIPELLRRLADAGRCLFVATSKPHIYARRIVEHFGLLPPIRTVYGSELDGTRSDKAELIAYLLVAEGFDPAGCVMIGDRRHDLIGAHANGVPAIGVTWGYGSREELTAEAPAAIVDAPAEIAEWVLGDEDAERGERGDPV